MTSKTVKVSDFLTNDQIRRCAGLRDHVKIRDQIIIPNLEQINRKLGQENNADYLAYMIEFAISAGQNKANYN